MTIFLSVMLVSQTKAFDEESRFLAPSLYLLLLINK